MNYNKYIHNISFLPHISSLPKRGEKEPEDPTKNNSDEIIEIEKDNKNETSNPEASQEKPE